MSFIAVATKRGRASNNNNNTNRAEESSPGVSFQQTYRRRRRPNFVPVYQNSPVRTPLHTLAASSSLWGDLQEEEERESEQQLEAADTKRREEAEKQEEARKVREIHLKALRESYEAAWDTYRSNRTALYNKMRARFNEALQETLRRTLLHDLPSHATTSVRRELSNIDLAVPKPSSPVEAAAAAAEAKWTTPFKSAQDFAAYLLQQLNKHGLAPKLITHATCGHCYFLKRNSPLEKQFDRAWVSLTATEEAAKHSAKTGPPATRISVPTTPSTVPTRYSLLFMCSARDMCRFWDLSNYQCLDAAEWRVENHDSMWNYQSASTRGNMVGEDSIVCIERDSTTNTSPTALSPMDSVTAANQHNPAMSYEDWCTWYSNMCRHQHVGRCNDQKNSLLTSSSVSSSFEKIPAIPLRSNSMGPVTGWVPYDMISRDVNGNQYGQFIRVLPAKLLNGVTRRNGDLKDKQNSTHMHRCIACALSLNASYTIIPHTFNHFYSHAERDEDDYIYGCGTMDIQHNASYFCVPPRSRPVPWSPDHVSRLVNLSLFTKMNSKQHPLTFEKWASIHCSEDYQAYDLMEPPTKSVELDEIANDTL